jgi:peptidoglycan/LPS O-acetylase OafA/YrhL
MNKTRVRTAGLDTLRASAIALVVLYHYLCFVSDKPSFGWVSEIGWTGVDLFFVLSGYLIANPLFKGVGDGRTLSVGCFYARRAFRTLPVYWLVLAAFWLFLGGKTPPPLWRFLTFTQNIGLQPGTAFSHAWSLCVEEQFYFLLPLILAFGISLAARRPTLKLSRRHGWALLAALTLLGMVARAAMWSIHGRKADGQVDGYMSAIYYSSLCRFDEFIPGIAVAMLKNFHRDAWKAVMARGNAVLVGGIVASAAMLVVADHNWISSYGYPFFMTTFGYSLLALSFSLLVVAALSPATVLHRLRIPGVEKVALWSYSIYLSHRPVANVISHWMAPRGFSDVAMFALIATACLLVGGLLYTLVEQPFMRWRDRLVPSNFVARANDSEPVSEPVSA